MFNTGNSVQLRVWSWELKIDVLEITQVGSGMTLERSMGAGMIKVGMNNRQPQIAQLTARDSLPHSGTSLCFGFQGEPILGEAEHWCPSSDRVRITGVLVGLGCKTGRTTVGNSNYSFTFAE